MAKELKTINKEDLATTALSLAMETIEALKAEREMLMKALEGQAKKSGNGGRQKAQPVKDMVTGKIYRAKYLAGLAVAPELGIATTTDDGAQNNRVWYEVIKKAPDRFIPATEAEVLAAKEEAQ